MPHGPSKEGGGGPPTPSPPKASWGLLLIGSCPRPRDPFFSIKTTVPFHVFTLIDDPVLSPEAQQGDSHEKRGMSSFSY